MAVIFFGQVGPSPSVERRGSPTQANHVEIFVGGLSGEMVKWLPEHKLEEGTEEGLMRVLEI